MKDRHVAWTKLTSLTIWQTIIAMLPIIHSGTHVATWRIYRQTQGRTLHLPISCCWIMLSYCSCTVAFGYDAYCCIRRWTTSEQSQDKLLEKAFNIQNYFISFTMTVMAFLVNISRNGYGFLFRFSLEFVYEHAFSIIFSIESSESNLLNR